MAIKIGAQLQERIDEQKKKDAAGGSTSGSSSVQYYKPGGNSGVSSGSQPRSYSGTAVYTNRGGQSSFQPKQFKSSVSEETESPLERRKERDAAQGLTYQPAGTGATTEKFWKGENPTLAEVYAQAYKVSNGDQEKFKQWCTDINTVSQTEGNPLHQYTVYSKPTSKAVEALAARGYDVANGISEKWLQDNYWMTANYRTTETSTTPSKTKKSTAEEIDAYWFNQALKDNDFTKKVESEQNNLYNEIGYWTQHPANYSDDEILNKIDWKKYPNLSKLDDYGTTGVPVELVRPVTYSKDILPGIMWAYRNEQFTGDLRSFAVREIVGEGKGWVENKDVTGRLNAESDNFNPYVVSSTMDDVGMRYGRYGFDKKWLDDNVSMKTSADTTQQKDYARIYTAEDTTQKAEAETKSLKEYIDRATQYPDANADTIIKAIEKHKKEKWPTLYKMDESLGNGKLLDTTRAIDYDMKALEAQIRKRCADSAADNPTDTGAAMAASLGDKTGVSATDAAVTANAEANIGAASDAIDRAGTSMEKGIFRWFGTAGKAVSDFIGGLFNAKPDPVMTTDALKGADQDALFQSYLTGQQSVGEYEGIQKRLTESQDALAKVNDQIAEMENAPQIEKTVVSVERLNDLEENTDFRQVLEYYAQEGDRQGFDEAMDGMSNLQAESFTEAEKDALWRELNGGKKATESPMEQIIRENSNPEDDADFIEDIEVPIPGGNGRTLNVSLKRGEGGWELERATDSVTGENYTSADEVNAVLGWAKEGSEYADGPTLEELYASRDELNAQIQADQEQLELGKDVYESNKEELEDLAEEMNLSALLAEKMGTDASFATDVELMRYFYDIGSTREAPEFLPYTVYDKAVQEGVDRATVMQWAGGNVRLNTNLANTLRSFLELADERGINLPGDFHDNIVRKVEALERDNMAAGYTLLDQSPDFDKVVADVRARYEGITRDSAVRENLEGLYFVGNRAWEKFQTTDFQLTGKYATALGMGGFTKEEQNRYFYLVGTDGYEAANKYLDFLTDDTYGVVTQRIAQNRTQLIQDTMQQDNGWGAAAMNVVATGLNAMNAGTGAIYSLHQWVTGGDINPNSKWFSVGNFVNTVRGTTSDMILEATGGNQFWADVYSTVNSQVDSFINSQLNPLSALGGGKVIESFMGAVPMAVRGAESAMREAATRYADPAQVAAIGFANFIAESFTEAFTYSNITGAEEAATAGKLVDWLRSIPKNALEEGIGEGAAEYIESKADTIVMGELSKRQELFNQYKDAGYPTAVANQLADQEMVSNIMHAALLGAAGSVFGSSLGYAAGRIADSVTGKETQTQNTSAEPTLTVKAVGEDFVPDNVNAKPGGDSQAAAPAAETAPVAETQTAPQPSPEDQAKQRGFLKRRNELQARIDDLQSKPSEPPQIVHGMVIPPQNARDLATARHDMELLNAEAREAGVDLSTLSSKEDMQKDYERRRDELLTRIKTLEAAPKGKPEFVHGIVSWPQETIDLANAKRELQALVGEASDVGIDIATNKPEVTEKQTLTPEEEQAVPPVEEPAAKPEPTNEGATPAAEPETALTEGGAEPAAAEAEPVAEPQPPANPAEYDTDDTPVEAYDVTPEDTAAQDAADAEAVAVQEQEAKRLAETDAKAALALKKAANTKNPTTAVTSISAALNTLGVTPVSTNDPATVASATAVKLVEITGNDPKKAARGVIKLIAAENAQEADARTGQPSLGNILSFGALYGGETRTALEGVLPKRRVTAGDLDAVRKAFQKDMASQTLQSMAAEAEANVREFRIAESVRDQIAAGGLDTRAQKKNVEQKQQNLDTATATLQRVQDQIVAAGQNLETANVQQQADAGNPARTTSVQQATKDLEGLHAQLPDLERSVENAQNDLNQAEQDLEKVESDKLADIRQTSRAAVDQQMQAEAEARVAVEQAAREAEVQQQAKKQQTAKQAYTEAVEKYKPTNAFGRTIPMDMAGGVGTVNTIGIIEAGDDLVYVGDDGRLYSEDQVIGPKKSRDQKRVEEAFGVQKSNIKAAPAVWFDHIVTVNDADGNPVQVIGFTESEGQDADGEYTGIWALGVDGQEHEVRNSILDAVESSDPDAYYAGSTFYQNEDDIPLSSTLAQNDAEDETVEETPVAEQPVAEQPAAEQPVAEQPVTEQPVAEQPVAEQPVAETPVAEQPVAETPVAEQPVAEQPVAEQPVAEQPVVETPVTEQPVVETPVAETPVAETPAAEQPVAAQPTAEQPAAVTEDYGEKTGTNIPNPKLQLEDWQDPENHGKVKPPIKKKLNPTNKSFLEWFRDATDRRILTNADGSPRVFMRWPRGGGRVTVSGTGEQKVDAQGNSYSPGFFTTRATGMPEITTYRDIVNWETAAAAMSDLGYTLKPAANPETGEMGYQIYKDDTPLADGKTWYAENELREFRHTYGGGVPYRGAQVGFVSSQTPLVLDAHGKSYSTVNVDLVAPDGTAVRGAVDSKQLVDWAMFHGFDSVVVQNVRDGSGKETTSAVDIFTKNPEQFKSAYNTGKYSPAAQNELYNRGNSNPTDTGFKPGTRNETGKAGDPYRFSKEVAAGVREKQTPGEKANKTIKPKYSPHRIAAQLANDLNLGYYNIGKNKMRNSQKNTGYWDKRERSIGIRNSQLGNYSVTMHEMGHALSQMLEMDATPDMAVTLQEVDPGFAEGYKPEELQQEAFAEFMWRYMESEDRARAFAGDDFYDEFEWRLQKHKKEWGAVQKARTNLQIFLNADSIDKAGAIIRAASDRERGTIANWFRKATASFVDSTAPAEMVNGMLREIKAAEMKKNGEHGTPTLDYDEDLRKAAAFNNTVQTRVMNLLRGDFTNADGERIGLGYGERLKQVGFKYKDRELLDSYLLAKHALDRAKKNKPVFGEGFTEQDCNAIIDDVEKNHKTVAAAAEQTWGFWQDVMQEYMVNTGHLTQEAWDLMKAEYPFYVSTRRVMPGDSRGDRRSMGGSKFKIYEATGGSQDIYSPIDSMFNMVNQIVTMNSLNDVGRTFDNIFQKYDGLGGLATEVKPGKPEPKELGGKAVEIKELLNGKIGADLMDDVLQIVQRNNGFSQASTTPTENTFKVVRRDGTVVEYQIDNPQLFSMLAGLENKKVGEALGKIGSLTRTMAMLTTGSNPLFALRNFQRDFQNSINYGSWATSYVDGAFKWLKTFVEYWRGESEDVKDYKALGGGGWTRVDPSRRLSRMELNAEVFDDYYKSSKAKLAMGAGVKALEILSFDRLNEAIEQTSRLVEYKYGKHDLSTISGKKDAFNASQEVSVDFNRHGSGSLAAELRHVIPFFGASMNGVYRTGRMFTEAERGRLAPRLAKTVINTGLTSALCSLLVMRHCSDKEKEEFVQMEDGLKALHFYLPNPAPDILGNDPLVRIPLAQDPLTYLVHGAVTNAMWSNTSDDFAISVKAIGQTILDNVNPFGNGLITKPITDILQNKTYFGSSIVPSRYQGISDKTVQYTDDTPGLFIEAGRVLGTSPLYAKYAFEQYSGVVGQLVMPMISPTKDGVAKSFGEAIMGGINAARKRFTSDPLTSSSILNNFYDSADMIQNVVDATDKERPLNNLRRDLTPEQATQAYLDAKALTSKGGAIYENKLTVADCYNRIGDINAKTDLTDKQKYEQTSAIRREMIAATMAADEEIGAWMDKYVNGRNVLFDRFSSGVTAHKPTESELMPDLFKQDLATGAQYMRRVLEVDDLRTSEKTGWQNIYPRPATEYTATDDITGEEIKHTYTAEEKKILDRVFRDEYADYLLTILDWEDLTPAKKREALSTAQRKGNAAIKDYYELMAGY